MQIYLTPPGGQSEGPFTLEQINRDLAARKYKDTDYWAWYSGQTEWVPLHMVPGVIGSDDTMAWVLDDSPEEADQAGPATETKVIPAKTKAVAQPAAAAPPPEPDASSGSLERKLFSGLPFAALEQVFILTTGDGPAASRSPVTVRILEQTAGESIAAVRERAQRDVVSHCAFIGQLRTQAAVPPEAWRTMANFRMQLVQDARAGQYKVCVRSFPIESGDLVSVFLFYSRDKLQA
jgi:hypothetical protein